ncbi:MAG: MFS transporter [Thermodesulfobacteriota bacterium]
MNNSPGDSVGKSSSLRALPAGIWVLGFGSLFMDVSSELVHSLLPVFMTTVLGASMTTIGVIEGIAEATASVTKVFSGFLSDYFRRRKFLLVSGYALAALTKPIFPLANSIGWVLAARFIDRVGKGIRGAPRDALVADIAPPRSRGAAYGLRQALDSIGAFLGPLLAIVLMLLLSNNIRGAMWVAVIPAAITVVLLTIFVREPEHREAGSKKPLTLADAKRLPSRYWRIVLLGAIFTLARFSEAFLILRAQDTGLPLAYVPAVMMVMNVFYAGFAYPLGVISDRFSRRALLLTGLALLIAADIILAAAASPWPVFAGAGLWGLHMACTQGLLSKLVADTVPEDLRGTAFGVFNLVSGIALLLASVTAGALWSRIGPGATFAAGAVFAALAAAGLAVNGNKSRPVSR